jgi:hypothetical protein
LLIEKLLGYPGELKLQVQVWFDASQVSVELDELELQPRPRPITLGLWLSGVQVDTSMYNTDNCKSEAPVGQVRLAVEPPPGTAILPVDNWLQVWL